MNNSIVEIKKITKKFSKVIANKNVSFNIRKNSVHALLGENGAGKSTLVKILYGLLKPDSGTIFYNNDLLNITSPSDAKKKGIGMVFQHFSLFESLTVRENLILGIDEKISYSDLSKKLNDISSRYELPLDLDAPIVTLSAGEKQRVEIVRILLQDPQLLIMDEPTSVLTPQEVINLFKTLNALIKEGRTILYITHKLEEVINLCDEVTIMRNGEVIDTCLIENQTAESLATKMLGEKLGEIKTDYSHVSDILTGENTIIDSGSIIFNRINIERFNPKKRRDLSIAFVPENRLGHSAVPELTLSENILLSQFPNNNFISNGIINHQNIESHVNKVISEFNVVSSGSEALASSLSGGNLQKFVIGREILSHPKLLIISHPTWGIDAGAEFAIRESLINLSKQGTSIIVLSQDLDELFEITHRIAVIFNGSLSNSYRTKDVNIEKIGLLMGGA